MKHFKLTVNAASNIGQRERNQDNLRVNHDFPCFDMHAQKIEFSKQFCSDELNVFCICDGIGGGESGDVASKTALEAVDNYLSNTDIKEMSLTEILMNSVDFANKKVLGLFNSDTPRGGTTIAMLAVMNDCYATLNLGDSPIYLFRNNEIISRSMEHNLAGYKKLQGLPYDEDDSCTLIYFLGGYDENVSTLAYKTNGTIEENDIFLLCSDGVTNFYNNRKLLSEIFIQNESLENILKKSGKKRYADNCTAIMVACSS